MSERDTPVTDAGQPDADISRWSIPRPYGGWLWIVILLLLASTALFAMTRRHNAPQRPFEWWTIPASLLSVVPLLLLALLCHWIQWRWMYIAGRAWKQLQRGNKATAERAYEKGLSYARSYPANHERRGVMLRELGMYLLNAGRHKEAGILLHESVAILDEHRTKNTLDYYLALNNLSVFFINSKDHEKAQHTLERAIDQSPALKKSGVQSPELEIVLRLNLAYLMIQANRSDDAAAHLDQAEKQVIFMPWLSRRSFQQALLTYRCRLNVALERYDKVANDLAGINDLQAAGLLWAQAKVHLWRGEFALAEQFLRQELESLARTGTAHRPDALDTPLDLAESLFGQVKYDAAFASLNDARNIVADFALPPDAAWRKTLHTWLQRAKELGRTELAASLEADLQRIPANLNQAITILEKLRIQTPASG